MEVKDGEMEKEQQKSNLYSINHFTITDFDGKNKYATSIRFHVNFYIQFFYCQQLSAFLGITFNSFPEILQVYKTQ
jgi:hypothetical protein